MLAEHVHRIIQNRLADENLTNEERTDFVNKLIDFLDEDKEDRQDIVADGKHMLSAVVSKQEDARLKATNKEPIRPLTGFRTSSLFTGGQSKVPMNTEIERDIDSADRISLIVSFLKLSGINLIYDRLKKFCENPNHKLRIITTTYCGVTEKQRLLKDYHNCLILKYVYHTILILSVCMQNRIFLSVTLDSVRHI